MRPVHDNRNPMLAAEHHDSNLLAAVRAGASGYLIKNGHPEQLPRALDAVLEGEFAISRLLVISENYPNLKSNENFLRLQDELAGTENRIAIERRKYNEVVQRYNTQIVLFPNNLIASISGFQRNDAYFKTDPGSRAVPKVAF